MQNPSSSRVWLHAFAKTNIATENFHLNTCLLRSFWISLKTVVEYLHILKTRVPCLSRTNNNLYIYCNLLHFFCVHNIKRCSTEYLPVNIFRGIKSGASHDFFKVSDSFIRQKKKLTEQVEQMLLNA